MTDLEKVLTAAAAGIPTAAAGLLKVWKDRDKKHVAEMEKLHEFYSAQLNQLREMNAKMLTKNDKLQDEVKEVLRAVAERLEKSNQKLRETTATVQKIGTQSRPPSAD